MTADERRAGARLAQLAALALLCGLAAGAGAGRASAQQQRGCAQRASRGAPDRDSDPMAAAAPGGQVSGAAAAGSDSKNVNHSAGNVDTRPEGSDFRPRAANALDEAPNARSIDHLAGAPPPQPTQPPPPSALNHLERAQGASGGPNRGPNHSRARRSSGGGGGADGSVLSPPRLVQWSREAVQYHEGSTLVLSCSLSFAGNEQAPLKFAWFKQTKPLAAAGRLAIETLADYSFLRLHDLRPADSGAYTCVVGNSLGQEDRTTTQVIVNVKLKWLSSQAEPPGGAPNASAAIVGNGHRLEHARAGQSAAFECNAAGGGGHSRAPRVRWFRLVPAHQQAAAHRAGTGTPTTQTTSGLTDARRHPPPPLPPQSPGAAKSPDEAQLRAGLLQLDAALNHGEPPPYRRLELANPNGPDNGLLLHADEPLAANGTALGAFQHAHARHARWRIETNSSPGLLGAVSSQQQQQHEIYSRLVLERLGPDASGLYECEVISAALPQPSLLDANSASSAAAAAGGAGSGDKLRRLFGLLVNGK